MSHSVTVTGCDDKPGLEGQAWALPRWPKLDGEEGHHWACHGPLVARGPGQNSLNGDI